jgi:P-type conjugative transfer protein TrbJ
VFDSASYGQLVQEISQGATEITTLENQLRQEEAMVQSLPTSVLGSLSPLVGQTAGLIIQLQNVSQGSTALLSNLDQTFPTSFTGDTPEQIIAALAAQQTQQRQAITQAQQIQAEIGANQAAMSAQVTTAESASASAVGTTQAIQATNQLVGNIATQLTEQNALLASAQNAQQQAALQSQSDDAAAQKFYTVPQITGTDPSLSF